LDKVSGLLRLGTVLGFLALVYLTQRFWFVGSWRRIAKISSPRARQLLQGIWILSLVLLVGTFFNPLFHRLFSVGLGGWTIGIARVWLLASFFAFFALQLIFFAGWSSRRLVRAYFPRQARFEPARRNFFRYAAYLAGGLPFAAASYGFAAGRLKYKVQKVELGIANLPPAFAGFKIVQLSDIHIGDFMPREEIRRAVAMANELTADLAVVTGDFISDKDDPLETCILELSRLQARLGVYGCNGNHEIYAGAEEQAQRLFEQHRMRLLRQERVELAYGGEKLNLIGVDYQRDSMTPGPHGRMLEGVKALVSTTIPNILLSHNPNSFPRAAELGIELSLAGHTHGGQMQFEIVDHNVNPARLITEFVAGLYRLPLRGESHSGLRENGPAAQMACLYVNRGLGTFGLPVRLGVPPEITLLTLRAA
jgi:predicted MPP superfamily phosphohydrolase